MEEQRHFPFSTGTLQELSEQEELREQAGFLTALFASKAS